MKINNQSYKKGLQKLIYFIPRLELALIINKNGIILKMVCSRKLMEKIRSISSYSSTVNYNTEPLINLILLGKVDNISIKATSGYFLIFHIDTERLLIIKTSDKVNLGKVFLYCDKIIEEIQSIPYDPKENNQDKKTYFI